MKFLTLLLAPFIVAIVTGIGSMATAQTTATIGTGTSSGYTYGPVYRSTASSAFDFSRYHYVYTASELSAAGVSPGSTISEISWFLNSTSLFSGTGDATMKVYVKNSAATVAANNTWANLIAGSTQVFNGIYNTTNNLPGVIGWMPFTFSSALIYTGGSLEVSVDFDCSAIAGDPTTGPFNWLYGVAPSALTTYSNSSTFPLSTTSTTTSRPNIQFVHTAAACAGVTNLVASNVGQTTADLSWDAVASATSYNWILVAAGAGSGATPVASGTTALTTVSVTTLSPNTFYHLFVQSDCGAGGLSVMSGPYSLKTPCSVYNIPYFEGFETGFAHNAVIGNCLSQQSISGSDSWSANNTFTDYNRTPKTGSWNAFLKYGNTDWMFIPVNLVGGTMYTTDLYARQNTSIAADATISISYGNSNTEAAMTNDIVPQTGVINAGYEYLTGTFTPLTSGVYYIGIKGNVAGAPWYISIDDLSIYETPSCIFPSNLTGSMVNPSSYLLGWTENGTATNWNVQYGLAGFVPGSGTTVPVTSNSYTASGLTAEVNYEFYVQSDCGSSDLSPWSGPFAFVIEYCTVGTTNSGDYLSSVTSVGAVSNITYSSTSQPSGGYSNQTSQSFQSYESQTFNINTTYIGGDQGVNVWIDWNNDYIFDASELVATVAGSGLTKSVSITVPLGTPIGDYRVRVRAQYGISANPPACGNVTYGSTVDFKLSVVLAPSCLSPIALTASNISFTSADLAWTESGSSTSWNIEYGVAGFTQGSGTSVNGVSNPHTITLAPNTNYQFYVQADCGNGDLSPYSGPYAFSNNYCFVENTSSMDFMALVETNGALVDASFTATSQFPGGYADESAQIIEAYENQTFNLNTFYDDDENTIRAWVDWNNNITFEASELVADLGDYASAKTQQITIPVGTPLGEYRMRVRGEYGFNSAPSPCGSLSWGGTVDFTLKVVAAPVCTDPSALSVANITNTSANLGWTENGTATTWNIEYGATGFTQGSGIAINGTANNPHSITGLMMNTAYEFYVQADCGLSQSAWVGPFAFTTLNVCDAPTALTATNISLTTAVIGWTEIGTSTTWNIEYGATGFTQGNGSTINGSTANPYGLTGLTANTSYEFYVQTDCGLIQSTWAGPFAFTTLDVCDAPTVLTATNITLSSVELGWTENGTATTWNIEYGATGFTQGSGTAINGTTTNPHALSGLTPNTNYEFYVQADCGSIESTWSGPFTFTTTSCLVTGQNGVMDVCELQDTVNLNSVIVMPSYPGTWVYAPVPSYIVNDTMFVISSLTPGAYLVNYVVTGLCPETIVAKIIIGKINNAGNDTAVTVCLNQPLNLQTLLSSGADANGTWLNPAGGTMTSSNITTSDTAGVFEYSYELSIGTCPDNVAVMTITVDADCDYLSVTQETMSDISVYPNPATTTLTILNPSNTSSLSVEMLDMNGRVVLVETKALNNATEGTLAIDHLEKGIYTLRIYKDGGQKIYKIVKQ